MLKLHTRDGTTTKVDLSNEEQAKAFLSRLGQRDFQLGVSGVAITHMGVQYALPRPLGFGDIFFTAEEVEPDLSRKIKGCERIICQADEVRVVLTVHREQRAARVSVSRVGKQRYNPTLD